VGKPTHARWRDVIRPSFLDEIVRQSEENDVYVSTGKAAEGSAVRSRDERPAAEGPLPMAGIVWATAVVTLSTLISRLLFGPSKLIDVAMVYLLGVVIVSMRFSYGPSMLATVASVVAFDFFFVPPYLSFAVSDVSHIVTFVVMFVVSAVISHLTNRVRAQADAARGRERRTASLYAVARELGSADSRSALLDVAARHVRELFGFPIAILLPGADGALEPVLSDDGMLGDQEMGVAEWTWSHQRPAGAGTDTLPSSRALFVPLKGSRERVGVLAVFPSSGSHLNDPDERQLLETFAGLAGSALERTQLAEEARRAKLRAETEQLRNSLLSSVSHDLRTPLAVVTGATSALLQPGGMDEGARRELAATAHAEALRLNRLVRNLLDMTRLEAGALKVRKELQPLEEVIGAALNRMEDRLLGRDVRTDIPSDLPLVPLDAALIEQVLINLLENATKYSPAGTPIDVAARAGGDAVEIEIADRGPGVPAQDVNRIFEKFYRAREGEGGGVGLGLTICRGIVHAHGGRIWVENVPGGGASFRFTLPLERVTSGASEPPSLADARTR
jgi:two-component system sensor histidine kinase KdpD